MSDILSRRVLGIPVPAIVAALLFALGLTFGALRPVSADGPSKRGGPPWPRSLPAEVQPTFEVVQNGFYLGIEDNGERHPNEPERIDTITACAKHNGVTKCFTLSASPSPVVPKQDGMMRFYAWNSPELFGEGACGHFVVDGYVAINGDPIGPPYHDDATMECPKPGR